MHPVLILLAIAIIFYVARRYVGNSPSAFGLNVGKIDDVFGVGVKKLRGH